MNIRFSKFEQYLPLFYQLFRFGCVGLTAATIHYCIVVLVVQNFGLPPLLANLFGFPVSFQMSYWGHRKWTFSGTSALHRVAVPKLVTVQVVNFILNETLFYIFLTMNIPYQIALVIVLATLPVFTFIMSKMWVFR